MEPFLLVGLFMASVLHCLAAVSRSDVRFVLASLQAMIYGCFVYCNASAHLTPAQHDVVNAVPVDIRTVMSQLELNTDFIRYAAC
ncbi:hypothetical protein BV20DRAFT_946139, partial [Pilatotrama ljubarskyi]